VTVSEQVAILGNASTRKGKFVPCATVEVYCSETSQWYTADPLPTPYYSLSFVTIADTCYLLGGIELGRDASNYATTVLYASLTSLVQKATSPTHQSASHTSVWKTLPNIPTIGSAAASLSGNLLAVGGNYVINSMAVPAVRVSDMQAGFTLPVVPAVHVFLRLTNSWVRVTDGDLPEPRYMCTAVQLSSNTTIVIGGMDNQDKLTKTVFMGTVTV